MCNVSFPLLYKIFLKIDGVHLFSDGILISYNILFFFIKYGSLGVRVTYNWPHSEVKVAL